MLRSGKGRASEGLRKTGVFSVTPWSHPPPGLPFEQALIRDSGKGSNQFHIAARMTKPGLKQWWRPRSPPDQLGRRPAIRVRPEAGGDLVRMLAGEPFQGCWGACGVSRASLNRCCFRAAGERKWRCPGSLTGLSVAPSARKLTPAQKTAGIHHFAEKALSAHASPKRKTEVTSGNRQVLKAGGRRWSWCRDQPHPIAVSGSVRGFRVGWRLLHSGSKGGATGRRNLVRRGQRSIVIGARSALFAPLADPGLVVVDEEHDGSYKQGELPYYNARDMAVLLGSFLKIPVLLGSATPSVESWRNAAAGRYELLSLPDRVAG